MYSYGPPHIAEQIQGEQLEPTLQQLCEDTECHLEDQPEEMNNREGWQERQGYPCWWHDKMMMMMKLI